MSRLWPALAVVLCATARGAAPSYSAAGIVSAASYAPGPFAPNTLVTIFGANLADAPRGVTSSDIADNKLPTVLGTTSVYIAGITAVPLLYVSPGQINFVLPMARLAGSTTIRVVNRGFSGPDIPLVLADAAPGLFSAAPGQAIATHANGTLLAPETPAAPGEVIVIYAAGLGKTVSSAGEEIPHAPSEIVNRAALRVALNGAAVDPARVLYAGVTPGFAGLYQINVQLPDDSPIDPEVLVFMGDSGSQPGLKLAVRAPAPQLSGVAER